MQEWDSAWRGDEWVFSFGVAVGRHRGTRGLLAHPVVKERRLVTFVTGSEVIFERVHVWWKLGDLAEGVGEIKGYAERYQMKTAVDDAEEKIRKDYFEPGVV